MESIVTRKSSTPAAYHRMSIAEKQAESLAHAREPSVTCPVCDTHVTPTDLLRHIAERCSGPREPHTGAKWLTWAEAVALVRSHGVSKMTLSVWTRRCYVRFRGSRGDRQYLMRDLVLRLARIAADRR